MEKSQQTTQKYKRSQETAMSNKMGNLEEIDKFFKKQRLPRLNQKEI